MNIYNGLLQDGDMELSAVKEFTDLSEQELDRIEILVQNLLKITKLDAGAIVLEKTTENVADMLRDVELHFAYRAKQEHKELVLSGPEEVLLFCDRDWLTEAIDNIVKNALDHTESGDAVHMESSAQCRSDRRKGQRLRHPSGGPAPYFQAVLPQPLFTGQAGHRAGPAAGKDHRGSP